jgi:hypothetical protein
MLWCPRVGSSLTLQESRHRGRPTVGFLPGLLRSHSECAPSPSSSHSSLTSATNCTHALAFLVAQTARMVTGPASRRTMRWTVSSSASRCVPSTARQGGLTHISRTDASDMRELTFPHEPRRTPKQPVLLYMSRSLTMRGLIPARVLLVASVLYDAILNDNRVTLR